MTLRHMPVSWWFHRLRCRWHAWKTGCKTPRWHPAMCRCGPRPGSRERAEREVREGKRQVVHIRHPGE